MPTVARLQTGMNTAQQKWKKIMFAMIAINLGIIAVSYLDDGETRITMVTGAPTGLASVSVQDAVQIILIVNTVNFGNVTVGDSKNTTTNSPLPFLLRNDGTVMVNVSISRETSSSALFSGTGGGDNTSSFQFKPAVAGEGVSADPTCSLLNWANVPGLTPLVFLCKFNYANTNDEAEVELLINVPADEPSGYKSESLVFTASAA
mgnify:CR=1 FL=1